MDVVVEGRGGVFQIIFPSTGISARVSRIRETSDGVTAEVVWRALQSAKSYLLQGKLNLVSARSRAEMARMLDDRFPLQPGDWLAMVERTSMEVLDRIRAKAPAVPLGTRPIQPVEYVVYPLIPAGEPSIMFGPGGAGKSYFALLISVMVATGINVLALETRSSGNVLYLDWEANERELTRRMHRIIRGLGLDSQIKPEKIPIYYVPCQMPLSDDDYIAEIIMELNPVLIVLDSLGLAAGGGLNDADTAIRFFQTIRSLGGTYFVIAHTPKNNHDDTSVFGSVYFTNLARNVWEVRAQWEEDVLNIGLFHRKANLTGIFQPIGIQMYFSQEAVSFSTTDVSQVWEDRIPLSDRIRNLLAEKGTPMRAKDIAQELGEDLAAIYVNLRRLARRGQVVEVERGLYQLAQETVPF